MPFVLDTTDIADDQATAQDAEQNEPQAEESCQMQVTDESDNEPHVVPFDSGDQQEEITPTLEETTEVTEEPVAQAQAVEQNAASPEESEDRFLKQLDLLGQMAKCVRERERAASDWLEAKEEAKEANKLVKECKEIHDARCVAEQQIGSKIAELMAGQDDADKSREQIQQADGQIQEAPEQITQAPEQESGDWRVKPTIELLKGTKRIGVKKLEAIAAQSPTVGDLEDLRGKASQYHKPFHSMLPDGCGQKMADTIEDKLIEHVAKFSQPSAADQVEPRAELEEDEPSDKDDVDPVELGHEAAAADSKLTREDRSRISQECVDNWREDMEDQDADMSDCDIPAQLDVANLDESDDGALNQTEQIHLLGFNSFGLGVQPKNVLAQVPDEFIGDWAYGWVCAERLKTLREIDAEESSSIASL